MELGHLDKHLTLPMDNDFVVIALENIRLPVVLPNQLPTTALGPDRNVAAIGYRLSAIG